MLGIFFMFHEHIFTERHFLWEGNDSQIVMEKQWERFLNYIVLGWLHMCFELLLFQAIYLITMRKRSKQSRK